MKNGRSPLSKILRAAGVPVVFCVLFVLGLSLWNLAATNRLHARNPVPGNFYSVNGRRMHIYCSGTGSPALVIEAAASASWLAWQGVQSQLSGVTRVCTYDRAGHGWSEPRAGKRDAETIVRELHVLLGQAGVERPVVLAGHSAGGLYVREYAREFPAEVAGVVLIDSSLPQQIDELPGWRAAYEQEKRDFGRQLFWQKLRVWSGWERLVGDCRDVPSKELQYLAGQYDALMCRPAYVGGEDSELMDFERTSIEAGRLTSFGDIPLLIITRDTRVGNETISAHEVADNEVWDREQEGLKSLSRNSWRVIARGSGHSVQHDRLDVVLAEIRRLLGYLRGSPPPLFGSTVIE